MNWKAFATQAYAPEFEPRLRPDCVRWNLLQHQDSYPSYPLPSLQVSSTIATMSSGATTKSRYFRQTPRKWFLRILAMLLICLGLFHLISTIASPNDSSLFKRRFGKEGQSALEAKRGDWCTGKEYLDGEWLKRDEEVTLPRLREIFKYTVSHLLSICTILAHTLRRTAECLLALRGIRHEEPCLRKVIRNTTRVFSRRRSMSGSRRVDVASTSGTDGTLPSIV